MFELDLDAIVQAVSEPRLMANPANVANPAPEVSQQGQELAGLATLAISHAPKPATPAPSASPATPAPTPAPPDPDRWCWPHSEAMNTAELHALQTHITHLQRLGLGLEAAERLADQRVWAQRQLATPRTCLQCRHLSGQAGALYCRNALQAGLSGQERVSLLSPDWVAALQRCNGFAATTKPTTTAPKGTAP